MAADGIDVARADALADAHDRDVAESQDAPDGGEEPDHLRLRRERAERRAAKVERDLSGPHRAAAYQRLVLGSDLEDSVKVILCVMVEEFGSRLENCFPRRATIARSMGRQRSLKSIDRRLQVAVRRQWLRRIPLTRGEDGTLIEVAGGRFTSATGFVFCVPPDVIAPGHPGWDGPRVWTKRIYARRPDGRRVP